MQSPHFGVLRNIALDKSLIFDILYLVDNCYGVRRLAPAFLSYKRLILESQARTSQRSAL